MKSRMYLDHQYKFAFFCNKHEKISLGQRRIKGPCVAAANNKFSRTSATEGTQPRVVYCLYGFV